MSKHSTYVHTGADWTVILPVHTSWGRPQTPHLFSEKERLEMRKNKPNRLRKIQLHIMISEAEDQMICERMKRCGYESKSEYIRRMSIDGGILVVDDADVLLERTNGTKVIGEEQEIIFYVPERQIAKFHYYLYCGLLWRLSYSLHR